MPRRTRFGRRVLQGMLTASIFSTMVKYGIKNIKRIGTIRYTNLRPPDFWAERGYDWYAGH